MKQLRKCSLRYEQFVVKKEIDAAHLGSGSAETALCSVVAVTSCLGYTHDIY